jgi:hypothetical protein
MEDQINGSGQNDGIGWDDSTAIRPGSSSSANPIARPLNGLKGQLPKSGLVCHHDGATRQSAWFKTLTRSAD